MNTNRVLALFGSLIAIVITRSILPDGILFSAIIFFLLATAIYNGYILYQGTQTPHYPNSFNMNDSNSKQAPFGVPHPNINTVSTGINIKYLLIGVCVGMIVLFKVTGPIAFYFFSVGDNLNLTYEGSPYIIGAIYGVFAGCIFGGFVACKKFKLRYIYALYPIGAFILLLIILCIHNAYFKSHYGIY